MSTLTPPEIRPSVPAAPPPQGVPAAQMFLFRNVSWRFYKQMLVEFDERPLRVTYDKGRMEIMTISNRHEWIKDMIGRLLGLYTALRRIPVTTLGSVTCFQDALQKGLEPDGCYYVQTPPPPPLPEPLDLAQFAPPDLAIEVEVTNSSVPKQPIYAAMGVRDIWRFDGENLTSLHRQLDGTYKAAEQSLAFPDLPMAQMQSFLKMSLDQSQPAAIQAMLEWVQSLPH